MAAAVVTALFALHPALVESVVWISGRKYVLPNFFSLLALWLAVSARWERTLSATHATATLIAVVAVMFSKSSYVAVAPIIAMLWVFFWLDIPVPGRRRSLLLWPLAVLFLAGLLTMIFIAKNKGFDGMPFYFGVEAVTRTLATLGWMTRLAVSPESRHFFYPVFEDTHLPVMVVLGVVVLAAAVVSAVMILRRRSLEGFAVAAFFLLCVPYIQLIPNHPPSLVSDRYLALAVWPAVLLIVALSWRLNPMPRTALLLVIALSWGYQTAERPHDWRSFEALMDADLRTYPGHYLPAFQKIMSYQLPKGQFREAGEMAKNIPDPELRDIMTGMIKTYYAVHVEAVTTGKPQEAIALLQKQALELKQLPVQGKWNSPITRFWAKRRVALEKEWWFLAARFPDDKTVRYNVGLLMLEDQRYRDAVVYLRAATESQQLPESVRGTAFKSLGVALLSIGHAAEAETPLRAALEQSPPELSAYCSLAEVYKQTGRIEEAASAKADCRSRVAGEGTAQ